jgi:hypothetical protein
MIDPKHESIARVYAKLRGLNVTKYLGGGTDGDVWATNGDTAIKCCTREDGYLAELASYETLAHHGIDSIDECVIPRLVSHDDTMLVIELEIVSPPYILDFGKVHFRPPDFSPETMEDEQVKRLEDWGDRVPEIQSIVWQLERIGIYYLDTKIGNIVLPGMNLRD